jgi:hypothetical protein
MKNEEKVKEIVFFLEKIINECSKLDLGKMNASEIVIISDKLKLIEKYLSDLSSESPMDYQELKKEYDLLLKDKDLKIN